MERELYDLGHFSHTANKIGRLQTMSVIPVVAGDSMSINLSGIVRLSPMRREVVTETKGDLLVFYVPHRHIYGDAWAVMMREGYDTAELGMAGYGFAATERDSYALGVPALTAATPKWLLDGYNYIWDQWFRIPFMPQIAYNDWPTGTSDAAKETRQFGRLCARLPHVLNNATRVGGAGAATWRDLAATDADLNAAAATIDVRDIASVQGELKSELQAVYMSDRYRDLMDEKWGTYINIDADKRPELCWHEEFLMSGTDVNGTDDATLGTFVGKTAAAVQLNMPRKHFAEHGTLWIMSLLRFPMLHTLEVHPLTQQDFNYEKTIVDPAQWQTNPPEGENWAKWLAGYGPTASAPSTEYMSPYGQWFRMHPNRIHPVLNVGAGYPWQASADLTGAAYYYHSPSDYEWAFQSTQAGHAQFHCQIDVEALRRVPTAGNSIFVGTH